MRHKGTVTWFSDFSGYGFIRSETGEELFCAISSILDNGTNGYSSLEKGELVTFARIPAAKPGQRAQAVNILRVKKEE